MNEFILERRRKCYVMSNRKRRLRASGWRAAHSALLLGLKDTSPPLASLLPHSVSGSQQKSSGQPRRAIQNDDETGLLGHSWGKMSRPIIIICISP